MVLRGFQDKQKNDQQTDSPAASRSGFRLAIQAAAKKGLHIGDRMNKPAYGLNDAPHGWWNILDSALDSYGLVPTRADRCTYVYYGKPLPESTQISEKKSSNTFDLESAVDYLMDPVSGNNAKNRQAHGALSLHVHDLLMTGDDVFEKEIMGRLRKDFQVGSEDKNDCLFVGQRIQWKHDDKHGWYINVHQNVAIDEFQEITFDKNLKDDTPTSELLEFDVPRRRSRSSARKITCARWDDLSSSLR